MIDPLTNAFLNCINEATTMRKKVAPIERQSAPVATDAPRGWNKCCHCGRRVKGQGYMLRRPPRTPWLRIGEYSWCGGCQRWKRVQAQIEAIQKEVPMG